MAFFGGSNGVVYRQFSITIVSAMALSVLVALIFTPALCVTLLRRTSTPAEHRRGFFGWFNRVFERNVHSYTGHVGRIITRPVRMFLVYGAIAAIMALLFVRLPSGFLPNEDQGFMFTQVRMPPGSTLDHTSDLMRKVQHYYLEKEAAHVEAVFSVTGFSSAGGGQNIGQAFILLKPWDRSEERTNELQSLMRISYAVFCLKKKKYKRNTQPQKI